MPPRFAVGAATLVLVLAYLPNLRALMTIWSDDPSYNHGYLVIPIALFILWQQLSSPEPKTVPETVLAPWWGWVFLVAVLLLRAVAYERGSELVGECNDHSCHCGFDMVVRQLAAVAPRLARYCFPRIHASLAAE